VWADLAVKNGMAIRNPLFDPEKPYDEVIIWTPEGLDRLLSMDETDVRTDQSKRAKSPGARSVIVNKAGSRRGHGKGKAGRKPKAGISALHRGGSVHSSRKVGGKQGLKEGQLDRGDALATKSSSKISFAGTVFGNGKSGSPHIMADHPLSLGELDSAPTGTVRDAAGNAISASFNVNPSGGMLEGDMLIWCDKIVAPSGRAKPGARGIAGLDGLGQHHTFKVVQKLDQLHYDIALRSPHSSARAQNLDFEHFATFKPAHEDAKIEMQVRQFQAARAKAAAEGREPSRAELLAAATLTDAQSLAAAKQPWMDSFSEERVRKGWADEGIVPFTRKVMWDLRKEEEQLGKKVSNVPPIDVSGFNIPSPPAAPSTALTAVPSTAVVAASATRAWDEGIDEEVEALLRAEVGDPNLGVAPVPPPKSMPKLGASLLFKLPGGVTGPLGKQLVRAKEVERRLNAARKSYRAGKRDDKNAEREDNDFSVAAESLEELEAKSFELKKLKLKQLQSLVRALRVYKGKGAWNGTKPESIKLLEAKFGQITKKQFQALLVAVRRGVAQVSLTASSAPPALPQPIPELPAPVAVPAASMADSPLPRALSRPRRG
jgi:hypothetical protein